jgi:hypothetical protein
MIYNILESYSGRMKRSSHVRTVFLKNTCIGVNMLLDLAGAGKREGLVILRIILHVPARNV